MRRGQRTSYTDRLKPPTYSEDWIDEANLCRVKRIESGRDADRRRVVLVSNGRVTLAKALVQLVRRDTRERVHQQELARGRRVRRGCDGRECVHEPVDQPIEGHEVLGELLRIRRWSVRAREGVPSAR